MTATGKKLFEISVEVTFDRLVELSEGLRRDLLEQRFALLEESERDEVVKGFATACELAASAARHSRPADGLTAAEIAALVDATVRSIRARN